MSEDTAGVTPRALGPRLSDDDVLQVSGLTVASGDRAAPVLRDVGLRVRQGEIVAVVGESGSGKSTLCRAILQLLPPGLRQLEGRILVGGRDLSGVGARALAGLRGREVGAVFQDPLASLDPVRRFRPQLLEARQIHRIDHSRREAHQWASGTLAALGFADPDRAAMSYPSQLSGGMRQRLCIGIAFSAGPSLILADEPVTSLDVSLQERVLDVLLEQRATTGAAVLLVAHDMALVRAVADRVVVMYSGVIVETAATADLFENPCHPYTRRLIASESALREGRQAWAAMTDSRPPAAHEERDARARTGCPYRHLCPRALPVCTDQFPAAAAVADQHDVYCWNSEAAHDVA